MKPARACCSALQHHLWGPRPRLEARLWSELRVGEPRGHGHGLAARAPGLLTPAAVSKSSGNRVTGFYSSDRGKCTLKLFGPSVSLGYGQASRPTLAGPISAASGDAKASTIKTDESKRDLYISFALCFAIKMYYTLQDKIVGLVDTKSLMSEKYVSLAVTMFSLIKAIYEAMKLAKEIRELIKYYRQKKKGQAN